VGLQKMMKNVKLKNSSKYFPLYGIFPFFLEFVPMLMSFALAASHCKRVGWKPIPGLFYSSKLW
jgi:hypothetical protein